MWDLSSPTRDRTHVPCIGRQILNHWTTREVPGCLLLIENHLGVKLRVLLLGDYQFFPSPDPPRPPSVQIIRISQLSFTRLEIFRAFSFSFLYIPCIRFFCFTSFAFLSLILATLEFLFLFRVFILLSYFLLSLMSLCFSNTYDWRQFKRPKQKVLGKFSFLFPSFSSFLLT